MIELALFIVSTVIVLYAGTVLFAAFIGIVTFACRAVLWIVLSPLLLLGLIARPLWLRRQAAPKKVAPKKVVLSQWDKDQIEWARTMITCAKRFPADQEWAALAARGYQTLRQYEVIR